MMQYCYLMKAIGYCRVSTIDQGLEGVSLEDLALKAEVNRSYMGSVERGEVNVSVLTLNKVLGVLKRKPSDLFKAAGL